MTDFPDRISAVTGGDPDKAANKAPGIPMKRAGTPEEIVATIARLPSGKPSYATGAMLDVAGGDRFASYD